MTDSLILTGLLALCMVFVGLTFWQLRRALQCVLNQQQDTQRRESMAHAKLNHQVTDLQHTMGNVINSLQTMGNQVHHLNTLADHAFQEVQAYGEDMEDDGSPRILIELRPQPLSPMLPQPQPDQAVINPEDLSPEMQEKFRTFRSVYSAILNNPEFPSRHRPDLN